ncbi:MAG: beta-lactamase family protein [Halioglobus sp.]|nr:beta-lactamase family protein [Halioglobus sp.]
MATRLLHFRLVCAGSLLVCCAQLVAADLRTGSPQREGMSPERLARIDEYMRAQVDAGVMVGGMGMISRNGKLVYSETWGMQDREKALPMRDDSIFRIYSMTKPITGVALMILYEEGKFLLNDPVAKYIPELSDLVVATNPSDGNNGATQGARPAQVSATTDTHTPPRQPTVRDLMRHTAGFTYGIFGDTAVDKLYLEADLLVQENLKNFVTVLGTLPLQYDPGSRWHYSVSVDVQGRLVEVLSGMSLGDFMQQRIFEPLGMNDTSFMIASDKLDRLTQLYAPEGTSATRDIVWERNTSLSLEVADPDISRRYLTGGIFESGGGGLLSTAQDYMRFCLMLLNGGEFDGQRILSPKTIDLMTLNHTGSLPTSFGRPGVGFGLDFAVVLDVGEIGETGSVGEYNWGGAAGTRFWVDPQESLIGIFMVQSIPHQTQLGAQFKQLTYQAIID